MARARAASHVRREASILVRQDDGALLEGVVDLAFREPGEGWTVVDFKTDVEIEARRAEYQAQVRLYVAAIAKATGERTRGLLLCV
jgi:ATP-dependent exoDNAse (exonuclease V) beta subunit